MRHILAMTITAIVLAGCSSKTEKREEEARLKTAITRAMCAPTMDDLKLALGDVAVASEVIDIKARKGRVAELADQITSVDCPGRMGAQPSSSLSGPVKAPTAKN